MRVVIFAGGETPGFLPALRAEDYVIAADSGALYLPPDILPNLLLGDMDSLPKNRQEELIKQKTAVEIYPREKDFTDLEAAVDIAVNLKASEIFVVGGSGGRTDHFFGNLMLLGSVELPVVWYGLNFIGYLNYNPLELNGSPGQLFSVIPLAGEVRGLTIAGAKYTLNKANLAWGSTRGLSNEFLEEKVSISWNSGRLMVLKIFNLPPESYNGYR